MLGELPESVYKPLDPAKVCRAFYDGIGLPIDDVLRAAICTKRRAKIRTLFPSISIGGATFACWRTSCPAANGWAPRCTSWATPPIPSTSPLQPALRAAHRRPSAVYRRGGDDVRAVCAERGLAAGRWGRRCRIRSGSARAAAKLRRNRLLVFSRYCQVMFRFEMALYDNPEQDLNRLWWDLVEKYQEIRRPEGRNEPDFASKYPPRSAPRPITITTCWARCSPRRCITRWFARCCRAFSRAGAIYVRQSGGRTVHEAAVFQPGLTLNWNDLTRHATGDAVEPQGARRGPEDCRLKLANSSRRR